MRQIVILQAHQWHTDWTVETSHGTNLHHSTLLSKQTSVQSFEHCSPSDGRGKMSIEGSSQAIVKVVRGVHFP